MVVLLLCCVLVLNGADGLKVDGDFGYFGFHMEAEFGYNNSNWVLKRHFWGSLRLTMGTNKLTNNYKAENGKS